jgi:type III secretory pathway component EscT
LTFLKEDAFFIPRIFDKSTVNQIVFKYKFCVAPNTDLAQKAAVLIGLAGQFYMVILTSIIIGKFIGKKD